MKVGIITVLYKSDDVIDGFIDSLNAQTFKNFEVFFVENDVDGDFCEKRIRERARFSWSFVRNKVNAGVACGNNQGIDHFLHREDITHIHFLNNDIEVESSFIQQHADFFDVHPEMDALAPKMFYYNSGGKIWYAGGCLSYLKEGPRHYGHNKRDILVGKDLFPINYAPTCSLMLRREVLVNTSIRMWEELFVYKDDYVFCKELHKAGTRMFYTPTIHLQHKVSSSTGGRKSDFSRYYTTRNWVYVMLRHRNVMFLTVPFVWLYHLIAGGDVELRAIRDALRMSK